MNIRAYSIAAVSVFCSAWLAASPRMCAQTTFTIPFKAAQASPASSFTIDSFGTFSEAAPASNSATFSFTSTPQMVWLPALFAFRAGGFTGSQTTVGQYSTAFGASSASGYGSFATGIDSIASGSFSTAFGVSTIASGPYSMSTGLSTAATAVFAFAVGQNTLASSYASIATGYSTTASGSFSTAMGYGTTTSSYGSLVLGEYNIGLSSTGATPSAVSWVSTDPVLEVGNGTSTSAKSDALVVYKNGNVTAQGVITAAPGGDIPMYTGN